jgi:hypothetical protein
MAKMINLKKVVIASVCATASAALFWEICAVLHVLPRVSFNVLYGIPLGLISGTIILGGGIYIAEKFYNNGQPSPDYELITDEEAQDHEYNPNDYILTPPSPSFTLEYISPATLMPVKSIPTQPPGYSEVTQTNRMS